jgi:hypothetical protein
MSEKEALKRPQWRSSRSADIAANAAVDRK